MNFEKLILRRGKIAIEFKGENAIATVIDFKGIIEGIEINEEVKLYSEGKGVWRLLNTGGYSDKFSQLIEAALFEHRFFNEG